MAKRRMGDGEACGIGSATGPGALPGDYLAVLEDIKVRVRGARLRAGAAVNRELIRLYWEIGGIIVRRQAAEGWGKAVVERLAADIQREFPGIRGFSPDNIWKMRRFYREWTTGPAILAQVVQEIGPPPGSMQPPANREAAHPPAILEGLPWGHNFVLLQRLKDAPRRLWYAQQAVANGWSRSMLEHWIASGLHARQGGAITNFPATLPSSQSDLARQVLRDPYCFDFLTLATTAEERDIERGLLADIRRFLLELGTGFAFVGQQVHLEVGGEDFYLDLLFYHLRLRCFVVVDLKATRFRPEHAGKLNFYLSAVDERMRHPGDNPSIGLILCRRRSRLVTEYALRDLAKPIGVSRYVTRSAAELPPELKEALPSPEQLEQRLAATARVGGPGRRR